jgi:hypothetical protein
VYVFVNVCVCECIAHVCIHARNTHMYACNTHMYACMHKTHSLLSLKRTVHKNQSSNINLYILLATYIHTQKHIHTHTHNTYTHYLIYLHVHIIHTSIIYYLPTYVHTYTHNTYVCDIRSAIICSRKELKRYVERVQKF